ncbi:hypothetical protein [Duganella sp. P38]|uniref:hypothetical protein n=1 Tax=Duganella sp. P38 TaxID=3423949 RepID=UPI003D7A329B
MNITLTMRLLCAVGALGLALSARAESIASSASSAGSASSGSVSDSLAGSSNSSNNGNKVADADYRIIDIAATPGHEGRARITMQTEDAQQRVVLDLPQTTFAQQRLAVGDAMYAHNRVYGIEFGRADNRQPFYLVLADAWYGELASRPLGR